MSFNPLCFYLPPVGGDSPSKSADAARGHAGQTSPEDHKVPASTQGRAEVHPGASRAARAQSHGECVASPSVHDT